MSPPEVPDEPLVDAASRHLLGPVLVHQLAGQYHAAVRAGVRSAEGVHVDADERAVGTERWAGGDADDERVFVSGDDQLGRAGHYLVWMMDFEPDGPLAVALFSQEFR